jgi:hypothetical protein
MFKPFLSSFVLLVALPALLAAGDLSKYRDFQLGTTLSVVAQQAGVEPSAAKTVHERPALIQELQWRPRAWNSPRTESVEALRFSFYDGNLFRIVVTYDRYETEGLTAADLVDAISTIYGPAVQPTAARAPGEQGPYGEQEQVLGRWEDAAYRFELVSTSYGPSFKLTGVVKSVEAQAATTNLEARRLDDLEAPERDAARMLNKPKFRP